jgi:hypothetical protein
LQCMKSKEVMPFFPGFIIEHKITKHNVEK